MKIQGRTILVTGGASGIGKAMAETLHGAGARVVIAGRRAEALAAIVAANPGMASAVLDVQDPADITAFAARMQAEFPELEIVIHNAGVMVAEDLTGDAWLDTAETIVATNLLGPIRLTAALLPQLRAQNSAAIVNVTSGLAFVPLATTPTYSATKAALHSWTESLRHQLRDTAIEVIEWAPPAVATDLMPGHAQDPRSMPLDEFTAESFGLLTAEPTPDEVCVERVRFLRDAAASGDYAARFALLNPA